MDEMATRDEMRAEALERMKMVGYWGRAREAFRRSGTVFVNEPPFGAVYDMEDDLAERVRAFERDNNALVYAVVRCPAVFGLCDSLLFVSGHKDEWRSDRDDLRCGVVFSYTINRDAEWCSEFGSIGFKMGAGAGYVRVL